MPPTSAASSPTSDLPPLDTIGLVEALRQHADLLTSRLGNGLQVSVRSGPTSRLPAAVEVAAYRIALEALTNTVRHAQAQHCEVSVAQNGGLRLTVPDDGSGVPASSPGVGLNSMRDRAEELGGTCVVTFREGSGTTVDAVLPVYAEPVHARRGRIRMTIRVVIVDDHPVYRAGLSGVLREATDIEIVGEADGGNQAVALAGEHRPDVVLMDLHMPELNGIEATRRLAAEMPEVKVLVLTMLDDPESVLAALHAARTATW